MVWIQQWGKMFDRNQKETFRMRDWCSAEGNRGRTVDLQTKNTNEHWWTRASEPFMWGKAQSDMKIERACLPYVPAKVLCEFCFCCCACAVGWLSQLNYQAVCIVCELITGIHCALFCSEGFFFQGNLADGSKTPKESLVKSGLNWTSPDRPISCYHCIEWIRPPRFIWENNVTQVNIVLLAL